ncbi:MAG: hypothetical protein P8X61_10765 [Limibacillus sp.]
MTDSEQISRLLHDANGSVQAIVTFLEFLEDEATPAALGGPAGAERLSFSSTKKTALQENCSAVSGIGSDPAGPGIPKGGP